MTLTTRYAPWGCERVIIAGASTDNTVLWTAADAHQNRYKLVIVEDCTMVHRQADHPHNHERALTIMRSVLKAEIQSLDQVIDQYLMP
jgi:nicotinamidase-related amidase